MAESAHTPLVEAWKAIPGFLGYEASDRGGIRSVERTIGFVHKGTLKRRMWPSKILKPFWRQQAGPNPYAFVHITVSGVRRPYAVHFLVCTAFHGPRPSRNLQAAHGDGDTRNNRPDNLRWATAIENAKDSLEHGRRLRGEQRHNARLTREDVIEIRRQRATGLLSQSALALRFGISRGTVSSIERRISWSWLEDGETQ